MRLMTPPGGAHDPATGRSLRPRAEHGGARSGGVERARPVGRTDGRDRRTGPPGYTSSSARWYDMSLLTGDAGGGLSRANALKAANRLSFTALWLKILGLEPLPRPGPALHHRARRKDASPEVRRCGKSGLGHFCAGPRWPAKQVSEAKAARLLVARAALSAGPDGSGGKDASEISRNRRIASMRLGSTPASARPGAQACCAPSRRCWSRARFGTDSLARTSRRLWRSAVALSAHVRRRFDFHWRRALLPADGCSCFYAARYRAARPTSTISPRATSSLLRRCLR